jgi:hypothetical protein
VAGLIPILEGDWGTAPGLPEAISFKLCLHGGLFQHGVVALPGFGRRDVADGLEEPSVVEPIHPFQGRELDGLEAAPSPRRWITSAL